MDAEKLFQILNSYIRSKLHPWIVVLLLLSPPLLMLPPLLLFLLLMCLLVKIMKRKTILPLQRGNDFTWLYKGENGF